MTLDENADNAEAGGRHGGTGTGVGPQAGPGGPGGPAGGGRAASRQTWPENDDWADVGSAAGDGYFGGPAGADGAEAADGAAGAAGGADSGPDSEGDADGDQVRRRGGSDPGETAGPRRSPEKWYEYLALPFVAAWRFAFPKKPRPFLLELPFLLAIALVLAFLIKTFVVQAFVIPSGSMQNTLEINDRVLVNRFANWTGGEPHRGDVVVFQDPGGWLEDEPAKPKNLVSKALTAVGLLPEDNGDLIKRVIGVGGDHVDCDGDGKPVLVNGVPLNETAYLHPDSVNEPSMQAFHVVVPPGHLWVMGDHRSVSQDSRPNEARQPGAGMVPVGDVVGIAVLKVWPPSHWGTLPVPATFRQNFQALAAPGAVPAAAFGAAVPLTLLRRRRKLRKLRAAGEGA